MLKPQKPKKIQKPAEREAFRLIEEMLELMERRGLVELEIEREGLRVRLKKAVSGASPQVVEYAAPGVAPSPGQPAEGANRVFIKSPMVGTFYRAPAPDVPPFVDTDQEIQVGQVVCIIEAMKLMNEIKAEIAGRVVDVLVQNGDPVEFGQPLFAVEPAAST